MANEMNTPVLRLVVELSDADLLARMRNFEDHMVERKTFKDERDWKKTAVAFANSVPVGLPAVLYIGVRENGDIEIPQPNLDEAQKKFNAMMKKVYPRIAYTTKILSHEGKQALAIIIPGSELRPHFAGLSYVRNGSESPEASEQQFAVLIASRSAKSSELLKWKLKKITVYHLNVSHAMYSVGRIGSTTEMFIRDCNSFYVTLDRGGKEPVSYPLRNVDLSFDHEREQLALEIRPA
jgi:predicted HTH transcriptional regulator